jgi:WD40 repeat protein
MAVHEHLVATGDEEGGVKLWDLRQTKQLFSWQENDDFISELAIVPNKNMILAPRYASPAARARLSARGLL